MAEPDSSDAALPHWPFRPPESAQVGWRVAPNGRLRIAIAHAPLRGVTPASLAWWFRHISGTMELDGARISRYRAWHARDHIAHEVARHAPGGGVGPGARFHLVEAFGGRHLDTVIDVERLDEGGIALTRRALGSQIFQIAHEFNASATGTLFVTRIVVGFGLPARLSWLNRFGRARAFPDDYARSLIRHSIEEVGNFEHFLPALYATETSR